MANDEPGPNPVPSGDDLRTTRCWERSICSDACRASMGYYGTVADLANGCFCHIYGGDE